MKAVALTACCVDYYPQIGQSFPGGNSLNVASMWKTLDPYADVSVIACIGKDANGEMVSNFLTRRKIDVERLYRRAGSTASNQLRVDEHGERFGIEGTWNGGVYESFLLSESDWEHVASREVVAVPGNIPDFHEILRRKHDQQLLAVDYLDLLNNMPIAQTIEKTDIAFISAPPACAETYGALAFEKNRLIVVTMGAHGSCAFYNGQRFNQSAFPVAKVVDTTGCGDAYQAAFTLTFFATRDIGRSMEAGARAAAEILKGWGGAGNTGMDSTSVK